MTSPRKIEKSPDQDDYEFIKTQWASLPDSFLEGQASVQPWHSSYRGRIDDDWQSFWRLLKNERYWNLFKGIGQQIIQPDEYSVVQGVLAHADRDPECISRQQWHLAKRVAYGINLRVSNGAIRLVVAPPKVKSAKPNVPKPYQAYSGWAFGNFKKR